MKDPNQITILIIINGMANEKSRRPNENKFNMRSYLKSFADVTFSYRRPCSLHYTCEWHVNQMLSFTLSECKAEKN